MPYKKRKYYRKRRPTKYTKRRLIKAYLRKKSKKGNATFVKLRYNYPLTTSSTGGLETRYNISNPTNVLFGSEVVQDWSSFAALYDQYRVFAVKIKYIPNFPNNESTLTVFRPLYMVTDYDSIVVLASVNEAIQYENLRVKNLQRPFSFYIRVPKLIATYGVTGATVQVAQGWFDIAYPTDTGAIRTIATDLSASSIYGTFVITYYVGFKNRR